MGETIPTIALEAANNSLDMMLAGIRELRSDGKIPTVEQIAVASTYAAKQQPEHMRLEQMTLLFAVAVQRLLLQS